MRLKASLFSRAIGLSITLPVAPVSAAVVHNGRAEGLHFERMMEWRSDLVVEAAVAVVVVAVVEAAVAVAVVAVVEAAVVDVVDAVDAVDAVVVASASAVASAAAVGAKDMELAGNTADTAQEVLLVQEDSLLYPVDAGHEFFEL